MILNVVFNYIKKKIVAYNALNNTFDYLLLKHLSHGKALLHLFSCHFYTSTRILRALHTE